jgi:hypothetical protein
VLLTSKGAMLVPCEKQSVMKTGHLAEDADSGIANVRDRERNCVAQANGEIQEKQERVYL